ncbi:MAG: type II toxin-antitoxin system RelB/DinJ family antitoxin [Clostridia bacterium]|nr:type II toxin-antitoxin system RelB/DinJ family antitoxin [Clostridia bacterium]
MAKVSTNISIDAETKAKAQELLSDWGLDLSTAVNIFLRKIVKENAIPFTIGQEIPNSQTRAAIEMAERDEDMHGPFDSVEALMEALNA